MSDTSDTYRIKLVAWRGTDGGIRYQANVYRPGDTYESSSPIASDRESVLATARKWIAADMAGEPSVPPTEWIDVP